MACTEREAKILTTFIDVYCRKRHGSPRGQLCSQCSDLLAYARKRLSHCPMDPKPKCQKCPVHCYSEPYRSKIRTVMKFSGMFYVTRGRLDWLLRYFLWR